MSARDPHVVPTAAEDREADVMFDALWNKAERAANRNAWNVAAHRRLTLGPYAKSMTATRPAKLRKHRRSR